MAENLRQMADGTAVYDNSNDAVPDLHIGGPANPTQSAPRFYSKRIAKMALVAGTDTAGAVLAFKNTAPYALIVDRLVLDITTKATGACTLSAGITAVSAVTLSANLIDAVDVGTATGTFDNVTEKGTLGKSRQKIAAGAWLTISTASGASAGMVGNAYLEFFPV